MRSFLLSLALAASCAPLSAQSLSWMESWPVTYSMNPGMPSHTLAAGPQGEVYSARQVIGTFVYGQDLFGTGAIERLDPATGAVLWSCQLSDSVVVDAMAVDALGNCYVAGRYMGALSNCDGSVLGNTSPALWNVDAFLMAYSPEGLVLWSRDLSVTHPEADRVASLAVGPDGALWYALGEFDLAYVVRVDEGGNDAASRAIDGVRLVGTIDLDPWGGLYVSGAAENNGFAFGGQSYQFPPESSGYQMFVLRYKPDGTAGFVRFASDVTFQRPTVLDDGHGYAYLAGGLMDSTSWGGIPLSGPDWGASVFVARLDSTGSFAWALESNPSGGPIIGDLDRAKGPCIAVDGASDVYLMGDTRGFTHWPGGVTSGNAAVPAMGNTLVKFDATGTAQWAVNTDASGNYAASQTLATGPLGEVYFALHAAGPFSLASVTVNSDGGQDAVVGKLDGLSTGIAARTGAALLSVWPNPAHALLNIQWSGTQATTAELMNSAGQRVRTVRLVPGVNTLDLAGQAPGLYALRTASGAVRVVKE